MALAMTSVGIPETRSVERACSNSSSFHFHRRRGCPSRLLFHPLNVSFTCMLWTRDHTGV